MKLAEVAVAAVLQQHEEKESSPNRDVWFTQCLILLYNSNDLWTCST